MMKNKLFIILLIIATSYTISAAVINLSLDGAAGNAVFGSGYMLILFMLLSIVFFIENREISFRSPAVIKLTFLFGFLALWPTLFHMDGGLMDFVRTFNDLFQWIFSLLVGYIIAYKSSEDKLFTTYLLLATTLPVAAYRIYSRSALNLLYADTEVLDITFVLLVLLPFVLTLKKESIKMVVVLGIGVLSIMSFKRTTVLAFSFMVMIYYYIIIFSDFTIKKRLITVFAIFFASIALLQAFDFVEAKSGGLIVERMKTINEDRGSDRLDIYAAVWKLQLDSSPLEWIFGHGHRYVEAHFGYPAHNDFLEVLYDYGLVSFFVYLLFLFQLISYSAKFFILRNTLIEERAAFLGALVLFVFLGMMNCFITIPFYFSTLMLYFGLSIGNIERVKKA